MGGHGHINYADINGMGFMLMILVTVCTLGDTGLAGGMLVAEWWIWKRI